MHMRSGWSFFVKSQIQWKLSSMCKPWLCDHYPFFSHDTTALSWHVQKVCHYGDVIMGTIGYQITSLTIVDSTIYSDADKKKKHQSSASLGFVWGIHRGQMASNAENVSIWWRHHVLYMVASNGIAVKPKFPLNWNCDGKIVCKIVSSVTHWGQNKLVAPFQTISWVVLPWMENCRFWCR